MIILTNPVQISNSLGTNTTTAYDKVRVVGINIDPIHGIINAQVELMVSADPKQPSIFGNLSISIPLPTAVTLQVPNLNFYRSVDISSVTPVVQGWINTLQNNIESGLVAEGMIAGTQSTGV